MIKEKFGSYFPFVWIKISRLRHLEFWSSLQMYIPFVPFFIYLLIKHRGFSALYSNPGIYMSGLIGERKSEIDQVLKRRLEKHRLKTVLIENPFHTNLEEIKRILSENELEFPLVFKPDSGLRGGGVGLVKDAGELEIRLGLHSEPVILQELSRRKQEMGVFFVRQPGSENGEIFSANIKLFPTVVGDGKSRLIDLVMSEEKYRIRFDLVTLDWTKEQLQRVPAKDERVQLVFRGSHSKGSLFEEGDEFLTEKAKVVLSKKLSQVPGFYFGRVDIKFDSIEDLESGEFDLIEVNGAGAESTNIYDPRKSKREVYSILVKQWTLAFSIGSENRKVQKRRKSDLPVFLYRWLYKKC